ncbi:MAG: hypothetical protein LYZ69_08785 [Nitrososphaerales archaeon]|nr:hypothetical protein [Nitrososphaerales archaeon]
MCATVYYTKLMKGKLYPKATRTSSFAYANEVNRERGRVVSKYIGIMKVPEGSDVVEKGGDADADSPGEPQQV